MQKALLLALLVLTISGCRNALIVTNQEFRQLAPFQATVLALEQIPLDEGESVLTAMTTDYRVTLERKDGGLLVIRRVSSISGLTVDYPGTMPGRMFHPTLKVGKIYSFPSDLYKMHPED